MNAVQDLGDPYPDLLSKLVKHINDENLLSIYQAIIDIKYPPARAKVFSSYLSRLEIPPAPAIAPQTGRPDRGFGDALSGGFAPGGGRAMRDCGGNEAGLSAVAINYCRGVYPAPLIYRNDLPITKSDHRISQRSGSVGWLNSLNT